MASKQEQKHNPPPDDTNSDVPALTTYITTSPSERIAALRLIADSVAQQRQQACRAIIFHPLGLCGFGTLFATVVAVVATYTTTTTTTTAAAQPGGDISPWSALTPIMTLDFSDKTISSISSDLPLVLTTFAGLAMAALVAMRWACSGYILRAEEIGSRGPDGLLSAVSLSHQLSQSSQSSSSSQSLSRPSSHSSSSRTQTNTQTQTQKHTDGTEITYLVTKYGERIVGALALASSTVPNPQSAQPQDTRPQGIRPGTEQTQVKILAWTVQLRYRRHGLGADLLEQMVRHVRDVYGADVAMAGLDFADEHANSLRILPKRFNSPFEKNEKWAREKLGRVKIAILGSPKE
ncbi:hypothetical protein L228DRAFT_285530 [Xylona heveae TC161]|uniref:N-acetyltransferase domain-containing protein n=1 Tax=Xylona heveae (strain CBS 132557 / TC161) TaxID=1328760 RepID=A0A164ZVD4_XYLHT|nr:hypothetical protein L228DRAFT_285530 [Xylona heveae TC161]KZF19581.1 hypothetical protein L228DRAFT_285530 [Xylona heveae TC161]